MKKNPKFPVYLLVLVATVSILATGCKKDDDSLKVTDVDGNVKLTSDDTFVEFLHQNTLSINQAVC